MFAKLALLALDHHENELVRVPTHLHYAKHCISSPLKVSKCAARVLEVQRKRSSRDLASVTSAFLHPFLGKHHPPPAQASDHVHKLESQLLSRVYLYQGQALMDTAQGCVGVVRQALDAFLDSAR